MKLSTRQVRQVVALDRRRHFGRAAEDLGISQPALSRSIQALEERLGVQLFLRSRAGVEPTRAGALILRHAQQLLTAAADLEHELADFLQRGDQEFSIAVGLYPADLTIAEAIGEISRFSPGLFVRVEVCDWAEAYGLLENGRVQLVLCERAGHEAYANEVVNERPVYFAVRHDHPLLEEPALTMDRLMSYPWACARIPLRAQTLFEFKDSMAGTPRPDQGYFVPAITAPSLMTALNLAATGNAVAFTPLVAAEPLLESGALRLLPFHLPWMRLNYGFAWRPEQALSAPVRQFMQSVRDAELRHEARERLLAERYGCAAFSA